MANELQLNGFIAQGLIQNKDNSFVNDDNDVSFDLTEVGLNAAYQFSANFRVSGQAVYLNGGNRFDEGLRLDYLVADWSFYNDERNQSHLYLGRIKNYHWLYSSTRDVPMTRPSIILPQSVYFDATRDMSVGGDGIAFSHKYSTEKIGEIDFTISSSSADISSDDVKTIIGEMAQGNLEHDNDLQASLYWQPAVQPWRFGIAITSADFKYNRGTEDPFSDGDFDIKRIYFNAEYFSEQWSFSAELLQEELNFAGLLQPMFSKETTGQGGFVQTEYKATSNMQFLMRYERYYADKDDKNGKELEESTYGLIPAYFGYQHDATLGFTYDFERNFKLQIEHHWVEGGARLTPFIIPDPIANPKEHWQLSAILLTYWF